MYTRPIVGVATRLVAGLTVRVTDCAGALRAVLVVLAVWFVRFLVFSRLARALI